MKINFRSAHCIFLCIFCTVAGITQTSGPTTPEVQTFTPHDLTQMVNTFTGDFTYNILLMDVGGFPLNLSYNSGSSPNDEAGFVGLGWNLNIGAINRTVRGLPDDFDGDVITRAFHVAPDTVAGGTIGLGFQLFGYDAGDIGGVKLGVGLGLKNSTKKGYGLELSLSPSGSISGQTGNSKLGGSLGLTLGVSSDRGAYLDAEVGFESSVSEKKQRTEFGLTPGVSISSREGLEEINLKVSYSKKFAGRDGVPGFPGNISFPLFSAASTYTPGAGFPIRNESVSGSVKVGGELFGTHVSGSIKGFWSKQSLRTNSDERPAYGYLFMQNAVSEHAYLDFNREKDGPYRKESPNLPLTNLTYDVFSVNGHGISGQFRPFRSDIGIVADPVVQNTGTGHSAGFEVGVGNTFQVGVDYTGVFTKGHTQKWLAGNALSNQLRFRAVTGDPAYEPAYFKNVGELTITENEELFNRFGGFNPIFPAINRHGDCLNAIYVDSLGVDSSRYFSLDSNNVKVKREPRNILFSYLNAAEAASVGLNKYRYSYRAYPAIGADRQLLRDTFPTVDSTLKPHHLSEITITRDDGTRFIFGLPVYNLEKQEVSFSITGEPDPATGLIRYQHGTDDSKENRIGGEQFYSATTTPAYAYAYLITAILSDDYVDITGDGPTPDDLGTYTRFNYSRIHERYKWRIPIEQDMAFYDEGMENDPDDDKAHYTYGEKEIWYIHSVETRNYVAFFLLQDRNDAIAVKDKRGGISAVNDSPESLQRLKRLSAVQLYSKADWLENPTNAVPIRQVFFEYGDSLCRRAPNTFDPNSGKLTLSKLWFKNGNSYRDFHSPYVFEYDNRYNFPYSHKETDRWGNYKADNLDQITNKRFPYTHSDKLLSDSFAAAWHLTGIRLPTGGNIRINYESDDYAYVQNRVAMEMQRITGSGADSTGENSNTLFDTRYLFFRLKRPSRSPEELSAYVHGIEELYFNFKVFVQTQDPADYETISGFIPMDTDMRYGEHYGFRTRSLANGNYTEAWIRLPKVNKNDTDDIDESDNGVNPVSKACWQTVRKQLPWLVYCDDLSGCKQVSDNVGTEIVNLANQVASVFTGENPHDRLRRQGREVGNRFNASQSFIRLNSPDRHKTGGGSRVKRLTIEDNWGNMQQPPAPEQNYSYAQEFSYITSDENGREISAGVAAYEPLVGGDENPFVRPHRFIEHKPLALGLSYYDLEPYGESFFPAPLVGYSNVSVRNIRREGVSRTANGFTRDEYYTAKDFPSKIRYSTIQKGFKEIPALPYVHEKYATVSQGYIIDLNDMHGKIKAKRVFAETNSINPVSSVEYYYKTQPGAYGALNNTVPVLNENTGRVEPRMAGVEYDIVFDAREISNRTETVGVQFNTDGFFIGPWLIPFPIPFPDYSRSISRYRGIVATKVIQRVGILDSVVVTDVGSRIATRHLAYNGKTGLPVITQSPDEHHNDIYTTNFPCTWNPAYEGMGAAYHNIGIARDSVRFDNLPGADRIFFRGDELLVRRLDLFEMDSFPFFTLTYLTILQALLPRKAWVYEVGVNYVRVIDELGNLLPSGLYNYKIIRSGRRNMQNTAIGQVVTLNAPLTQGGGARELQFEHVLDASAIRYSENRQTYLAFNYPADQRDCSCQPLNENIAVLRRILDSCQFLTHNRLLLSGGLETVPYRAYYEGSKLRIEVLNLKRGDAICVIEAWTADGEPFPTGGFVEYYNSVYLATCDPGQPIMFAYRPDSDGQPGAPPTTPLPTRLIYAKADCLPLFRCTETTTPGGPISCVGLPGARINPFVNNTLNNWRPEATYKYITDRSPVGTYTRFDNFWQGLSASMSPPANPDKWQRADQVVRIDPYGNSLESRDALNRYSSVQFGYNKSLPVATAENARYDEIGFEGFEDDAYASFRKAGSQVCPRQEHFKFRLEPGALITSEQSHTGRYSLRLDTSDNAYLNARILPFSTSGEPEPPGSPEYALPASALIPAFSPLKETAREFVFSAWVKVLPLTRTPENLVHYASPEIIVDIDDRPIGTFRPSGPVIDGWQQITGALSLHRMEAVRGIGVRLNANNAFATYFDDIRIHPFNSVMKSYVFDPVHLRLWAELDENNFATFYEYDQEGNLMRTKKETERGIVTLQEVLAAKPKRP